MQYFYHGRRRRWCPSSFPDRAFARRGWMEVTDTQHRTYGLPTRSRVKAGTEFTIVVAYAHGGRRVFRIQGHRSPPRLKSVAYESCRRFCAAMAYGRQVWVEILAA